MRISSYYISGILFTQNWAMKLGYCSSFHWKQDARPEKQNPIWADSKCNKPGCFIWSQA